MGIASFCSRFGRRFAALLAVGGLGLALVQPAHANKGDDTLRFAAQQSPESIDPYFNTVRIGVIIGANVWDTLLYRDPKTGEFKGQLAKSWKRVEDRAFEFELRKGIKFHNGEDFDADSVVYTLNYVSNPSSQAKTQDNVDWIEKAEKIDRYHVRIRTKTTFPAALHYLAGPLVIYPAKYYAEVGPKGMSAKPVGTGPYKVIQYVPGKLLSLERNTSYFAESPRPKPQIARVDIRFIPDMQTQMAELLSGGLDLIMNVPQDQAEQAKSLPNIQALTGDSMRFAFLQLNELEKSPNEALRDLRVRKAIIHAIDREGIARQTIGAGARVIHTMCYPTQWGCTEEGAAKYPYDPALAKKLLAEAGYPKLETEIIAYRDRPQVEAIIGNLAAVGIHAKLNYTQAATGRELVRGNKSQLAYRTEGSNDIADTSASTPVYFAGGADDVVKDATIGLFLNSANVSPVPRTRAESYKNALSAISGKVHAVPLWTLPVRFLATKELNFPSPSETPRFSEMTWK